MNPGITHRSEARLLIRLPAPSPRKNGEKFAGRNDGTISAKFEIGEIINEIKLLPVFHGEKVAAAG